MLLSVIFQNVGLALAGLAGAGVFYMLCIVIYRIWFHPLSKYPGPLLAKITDAHQLYHAMAGNRHLWFYSMHQNYGPVVRFGPNAISFNSNKALKDIYGFKANVIKAPFYDAFAHPTSNTHNTRDKELHARKRRVLSQAFSDSAIREVSKYVLANVRTFCQVIGASAASGSSTGEKEKNGWSAPMNMNHWFNYLAMDVLGDLCYGKAFHLLESSQNRFALELVELATTRHLLCATMPIIDKLGLDKYMFPQIAAGRAKYLAYSKAQLTERTKLGEDSDRRDFFHYLLKARDPETGEGFKIPELWAESNLLIIAGSDTTSTAMAATVFYLCRNPTALKRVTNEIRSTFSNAEDIVHGPRLSSCTFLRACIDEAMRMSPSVGGLPPRQICTGGHTIDGHVLPAGTVVGTPHYAIHHNESYYPSSFSYIPERWMVGERQSVTGKITTEESLGLVTSAYCPFSIGPRGCIGKGLAYIEMMQTLARTLYLYDIRRAVGVADPGEGGPGLEAGRERIGEFQLKDIFTSKKNGPMVEFRRADVG